jgi:hypothetical protein
MLLFELVDDVGEPAYEHDCADCRFVGTDHPVAGEPAVNQVDMYVHVSPQHYTLIRRYSSDPPNYGSWEYPGHMTPRYQRVLDAGRRAGIIA